MDNRKANNNKRSERKKVEDSKIESFTDLQTWQKSHDLVTSIYELTELFPKREVYGLTDQIHRSAVSITSNIAEGFGRYSYSNRLRFYRMSRGSLTELQNQLLIARDVGYLDKNDFDSLADKSTSAYKLLQGLIRATKERKEGKGT